MMLRPAVICLIVAFVSFVTATPGAYRHRKAPAEVQRPGPVLLDDDDDDEREALMDEDETGVEPGSTRRRRA
jgi:hypothetical protein